MQNTQIDPHRYTITIRKIVEADREYFAASVAELPDVAAFEPSYAEAYEIVIEAITSLAETARDDGREFPMPNPAPADEYSGRVTLRLSPSLHARLDAAADSERVSLNSHIVNILSSYSTLNAVFSEADRCRLVGAPNPERRTLDSELKIDATMSSALGFVIEALGNGFSYKLTETEPNLAVYRNNLLTQHPSKDVLVQFSDALDGVFTSVQPGKWHSPQSHTGTRKARTQ